MHKRSIIFLQCAAGLGAMSYGAMFTIVDDLRDSYGISESQLGIILGIGFFAGFFANIFLAPYADRGRARQMILAGLAIQIAGNLLFGFSESFALLFIGRAIMGIGGGMIYPSVRRIVILADPSNMGSNLGRMLSFDVGGFTLGPVISALTVGALGIAAPFVLISAMMVLVGVGIARIHVSEAPDDKIPSQRLAFDLFRLRPFTGIIVIVLSLYVMIGTFDALWSLMMKDMGAQTWVANLGISLFALPMLFLGPIGGRFTQNIGPFRASIGGLLIASVFMSMYGILASPYPMLAIGVLHGIVDGMTVTGGASAIAMVVPRERIAAAQGMQGASQTIVGGIASVVAGTAYDVFGRTSTFIGTAAIMVMCIATGAWLARAHLGIRGSI